MISVCARVLAVVLASLLLASVPAGSAQADPRWVFYSKDKHQYDSPWFAGEHRIMIPFGCTRAPYYSPDPRCRNNHGFHHGIDIAMPCGTRLLSRPERMGRQQRVAGLGVRREPDTAAQLPARLGPGDRPHRGGCSCSPATGSPRG